MFHATIRPCTEMDKVSGTSQMLHNSIATIAHQIAPYWKIKGGMKRLNRTLEMIYDITSDAEELQQRDGDVKRWLRMLNDVAYDVEDVLGELSYELMRVELKWTICCSSSSKMRDSESPFIVSELISDIERVVGKINLL
ncbi:putative disease resistance protein RGA4 [Papaver somniferum]|uniref:putative disease resistance protein RGA4 n=1 Tax=Papaver somniferum TaxID=3469 RepID=UPI000E705E4C|nr:putative disease resistance protein RGA4 [Papaver somniferum]